MPRIGSHSSGGSFSHSSGGSSFISSGGHHGHYHHGPRFYFFGGRRYVSNSHGWSACFSFMTFILFISIIMWVNFGLINNHKQTIENDFTYYQELADTGIEFNAEPLKYTSYQIVDGTTYYFITFEIDSSLVPWYDNQFETTSTYTAYEAKEIIENGVIVVCTDGSDAIQKSFNKETDKEYIYRLQEVSSTQNIFLIIGIVLIVVAVGLGALGVHLLKKSLTLADEKNTSVNYNTSTKSNINLETQNNLNSDTESHSNYCNYCGTKIEKGLSKCPECGAKAVK